MNGVFSPTVKLSSSMLSEGRKDKMYSVFIYHMNYLNPTEYTVITHYWHIYIPVICTHVICIDTVHTGTR